MPAILPDNFRLYAKNTPAMKNITYALLPVLFLSAALAQTTPEVHYIEVTGSAEMEIVPDEIYIHVTLQERYDGREKVTIAQQDEKFLSGMQALQIPLNDISLADAVSDYSYYKWKKEDALATKEYIVMVHTAGKVAEVYQKLVDIDAENAYIARTSHSKIEQYRKEVKINAMKATYDKAGFLLEAIGHKVGKPLIITEISNDVRPMDYVSQYELSNYRSNYSAGNAGLESQIGFQKIKLRYEIYGKFEIQ